MTAKEAESVGKLVSGLILFGSAGCYILGYGLYAFFFCLLVGFGSFGGAYSIWRTDREHNLVRILFPITGASVLYAGIFALFYVVGFLGGS
ncbi:MAG: hypothetical protein RIC16_06175 [Rhodospirillales bacterium]